MLQCLSFKPSSSAASPTFNLHSVPPLSQAGTSTDGTPISSTQQSPGVNLTREYTLAVQTNSYNEMWSRIHDQDNNVIQQIEFCVNVDDNGDDGNGGDGRQQVLTQVLSLNRDSVEEALNQAKHNVLTRLASNYFDHSENTTYLCLLLRCSVRRARALYDPLRNLLDVVNLDSDCFSQSQCDCAYDIFVEFDRMDNPFTDSHNFNEMRGCFSQLEHQLSCRIRKSQSRVSLVHRATAGSVLCVIGTVVAVVVSAVAIATHTVIAFVACPFCAVAYLPHNITRKEHAHKKQLNDAKKDAYVLDRHLETIESLVSCLYTAVKNDKELIQIALGMGRDKHLILGVLKLLQNNHLSFFDRLNLLEEKICWFFIAVNKARSSLHDEIHLYHSSRS